MLICSSSFFTSSSNLRTFEECDLSQSGAIVQSECLGKLSRAVIHSLRSSLYVRRLVHSVDICVNGDA